MDLKELKGVEMIEITDSVPLHRYKQWHEVLCATNGRYLSNPYKTEYSMIVHYTPGDYNKQLDLLSTLNLKIKETDNRAWYKTCFNRFKSIFIPDKR